MRDEKVKRFIYLVQTDHYRPEFEKLVSQQSDCIVLFWRDKPVQILRRQHSGRNPDRQEEIHLFPDGRMSQPGRAVGSYEWCEKDRLTLQWASGSVERFFWEESRSVYLASNGQLTLTEIEPRASRHQPPSSPRWDRVVDTHSTWNSGRNRLLKEALGRGWGRYDYYIFMDDDVSFEPAPEIAKENPYREFERFLSATNPAVGYTSGGWHSRLNSADKITAIHAFDACFNAFHKDTLPVLLPYFEGFDRECWWWSQVMMFRVAGVLYPGAAIQYNQLEYTNHEQRPYPRTSRQSSIPHDFIRDSLHQQLQAGFERLTYPIDRVTEYPIDTAMVYTRNRHDLAKWFNLEHEYWQDKIYFWRQLLGTWPTAAKVSQGIRQWSRPIVEDTGSQ